MSSASRKEKVKFLKSTSPTESSSRTNQTSSPGKPEAPATETNPFSMLGEKDSTPSSNPLEAKEKSIQGSSAINL